MQHSQTTLYSENTTSAHGKTHGTRLAYSFSAWLENSLLVVTQFGLGR